ncbi:hypothetical protein ACIPV2_00025 [Microbacterium sp. NPDC089987]|uniref:hypothetical protein n=1 Tax=Microbacterium sp. NPDC089987 TaxID=3364202 RepID=UPI0038078F67
MRVTRMWATSSQIPTATAATTPTPTSFSAGAGSANRIRLNRRAKTLNAAAKTTSPVVARC